MQIRYREDRGMWEVDFGRVWVGDQRRRVQRYFATKKEAEREAREWKEDAARDGKRVLSVADAGRFAAALRRLEDAGVSLEDAVEWACARGTPRVRMSVRELVDAGLAAAEGRGLRVKTVELMRVVWRSFARGREEMDASTVGTVDILEWMRGAGWRPRTQRSYVGELGRLFKWGISAGAVVRNPCDGVRVDVRGDEVPISCMSPWQAGELLRVARDHYADFLGYVVLGLFCGLRAIELERLDRAAVDVREGVVIVGAATAKTRSRRVVKLPKNAQAWLRKWVPSVEGRVLPFSWERRWAALRERAGWELPWPKNVMRHTFASMHFARWGNEAELKAQMGHHAGEETLHRHYRAAQMLDGRVLTERIAREFWGLSP